MSISSIFFVVDVGPPFARTGRLFASGYSVLKKISGHNIWVNYRDKWDDCMRGSGAVDVCCLHRPLTQRHPATCYVS